jgi:hypothetical protein
MHAANEHANLFGRAGLFRQNSFLSVMVCNMGPGLSRLNSGAFCQFPDRMFRRNGNPIRQIRLSFDVSPFGARLNRTVSTAIHGPGNARMSDELYISDHCGQIDSSDADIRVNNGKKPSGL